MYYYWVSQYLGTLWYISDYRNKRVSQNLVAIGAIAAIVSAKQRPS